MENLKPVADGSHPVLTALDLANLAAQLDPHKCRNEPDAALKGAFEFYNLACLYVEKMAQRDSASILMDAIGTPLGDKLVRMIDAHHAQQSERAKLRLYPEYQTGDGVRAYLGVKTLRAVREKLKRYFASDEPDAAAALREYEDFMKAANRVDDLGAKFWAIDKQILDEMKWIERTRKRLGGQKAARRAKLKRPADQDSKKRRHAQSKAQRGELRRTVQKKR